MVIAAVKLKDVYSLEGKLHNIVNQLCSKMIRKLCAEELMVLNSGVGKDS